MKKERIIFLWFQMWLQQKDLGIDEIFASDAIYTESWGPRYQGRTKIKHWFNEWNTRGQVLIWDIKQYWHRGNTTIVEWYFKCTMNNGETQAFDGLSLIEWTNEGTISTLKEFGCNINNYDPYQEGSSPHFKEENPLWF